MLAIYDKNGVQQGGFQDLKTFFSALGVSGDLSDPRLVYDQQDGRFILTVGEADLAHFTNGHVLVAVSQSSDPTGAWFKYAINFMGRNSINNANTFPDFPGLGLSATAIYITSNQFVLNAQCLGPNPNSPCAFSDAWIKVIGLPELLSGNSALKITTFTNVHSALGQLAFGIQPAVTYGMPGAEFLVAASFASDPGTALNLFSISTSGTPTLTSADLTVPSFILPSNAVQGGSGSLIDTNDFRTLNAVWSSGSLWCGQNVESTTTNAPAARWYQILLADLSTASLVQSGDVTAAGAAYFPALSEQTDGTVGMAFTTSSAILPPSAAFTGREPADTLGTMRSYVIYRLGLSPYDEPFENRWGDYSGISVDAGGNSLWTIAEYAGQPDPHFGTAIAQMTGPPSLAASPGVVNFGAVLVGQSAMAQTITINNISGGPITLGTIAKAGASAADFTVSADLCSGISLAAGQSCSVTVNFTPSQQAFETGSLSLDYSQGELVVGLEGSGVIQAILNVTPSALNFPPTPQQTASAPQTLTLMNSGNAPGQVSFFFNGGIQVTETNNCGTSLAAGASCQFVLTFRPTSAMNFSGVLEFNFPGITVPLTGTGITIPNALFCPTALNFGNQGQGTTSPTQTIILTNNGSAPLTITGVSVTGDFAETDDCGGGFGPRASCSIQVTFTPTALGMRSGQIVVSDNGQGSPQTVPLSGTGIVFPILPKPKSVASLPPNLTPGAVGASEARHVVSAERPLNFEANAGQFDPALQYVAHVPGYQLGVTTKGILLEAAGQATGSGASRSQDSGKTAAARVEMTLAGAKADAQTSGLEELPGKANYFLGQDPGKWRRNVPTYARVKLHDVYPGVDLVYYGSQRRLEYDFVVAPGADPQKISLNFGGASALRVARSGDLIVSTTAGEFRLHKPIVYQTRENADSPDDTRLYRSGGWVVAGKFDAAFRLGPYDRSMPLVIDPVLTFSTYLGGSGGEEGHGIGVDSAGNVYIAGITSSMDFPVTAQAVVKTCGTPMSPCSGDGFVAKLSADGSTLLYATYLGGSLGGTNILGIAVDSIGNAYLTGSTHAPDFPTTPGVFQPQCTMNVHQQGCSLAFVTKLDSNGSSLVYSTYLGGTFTIVGQGFNQPDVANSIAVDSQGNAYVGGAAGSPDFPVTPGAFETTPPLPEKTLGFLSEVNPTGSALVFSTFLGGSGDDVIYGVALDPSGNAYVTGTSYSLDFPTTPGAFQTGPFSIEGFVAKFGPSGSLIYSTLLGGAPGIDFGYAIAVDSVGAAYVTGETDGGGFPVTANAFYTGQVFGNSAPFAAKLHPSGCALLYGTYLAAGSEGTGESIAVDAAGDAYVAGRLVGGRNFPLSNPIEPILGSGFGFVSELNPSGSAPLFSTAIGGSFLDNPKAVALDASGNIYVTGIASSVDLPIVNALQSMCADCQELNVHGSNAFVEKIGPGQATGIFLTRSSLQFAPIPINFINSENQAVGLVNNQSVPLNIQSVTLAGAGYSLPASPNPCAGTLPPGVGCVIDVQFLPTVEGPAPGTITITDDGPGSPRQILINGSGTADIALTFAFGFAPLLKGTASASAAVNVTGMPGVTTPTGNVQLSCSGISPATCSFNPPSISLPFGAGSSLTVDNLSGLSGDSVSFTIVATIGVQTATLPVQLLFADFSFTAPQATATVTAGQLATFNGISVSPINGFNSPVSLTCSNLPPHASCTFQPPVLTPNGPGPVSSILTISTESFSQFPLSPPLSPSAYRLEILPWWFLGIALLAAIFMSRRETRWACRVATASLILLMFLSLSCGGGGGGGTVTPPPPVLQTTPPGNYMITVSGSAGGSLQYSAPITLQVK